MIPSLPLAEFAGGFVSGVCFCLSIFFFVSKHRANQKIVLPSGNLPFEVEIDSWSRTWSLNYPSRAEVPINFADSGRVVVYSGKHYRIRMFYGNGTPVLESIR